MPAILLITILAIFLFRMGNARSRKQDILTSDEFWRREQEANFVRRADISGLPYVVMPPGLATALPQPDAISDDPDVREEYAELTELLEALSQERILNLTGLTNTELKLQYGVANLDTLTRCDENFTLLCRTLNRLGSLLAEASSPEAAMRLLSFAVECRSDIQESYLLLASLYHEAGNQEALAHLADSLTAFDGLRRESLADALLAYHVPE